jgi:hypothetical protein
LILVVDCFQRRKGEVAGGCVGASDLWNSMSGLVCCKIWTRRDIRRRARLRGREGVRKEAAGSPVGVGIVDARRQNMRASDEESEQPDGAIHSREKGE